METRVEEAGLEDGGGEGDGKKWLGLECWDGRGLCPSWLGSRGILVHKLGGQGGGARKSTGRLELIPLIKNALVWRCQGRAAVFKASLAPRGPPRPGRLAAPSQAGCQGAQPADACPLTDRALANVLLLRVVVIYILSVYINLSAAALAAPPQSACLLRSLGDFPRPTDGQGSAGGAGPASSPALGTETHAWFRPGPHAGLAWGNRKGQPGQGSSRRLIHDS